MWTARWTLGSRTLITPEMHDLLDTIIRTLRQQIDHARLPDTMSISAVTLAKLSAGHHHTGDPDERARRLDVLQRAKSEFDPLPFDAEAAPKTRAGLLQTAAHLALHVNYTGAEFRGGATLVEIDEQYEALMEAIDQRRASTTS